MIIGAQKAGTTALKNILGKHSSIQTHEHTEFGYFYSDEEYSRPIESIWSKYFSMGTNALTLAKNAHFCGSLNSFSRLHKHNPECRLILIVRDPVSRAFSSYLMGRRVWFDGDQQSFKKSLNSLKEGKEDIVYRRFLSLGLYDEFLEAAYKYFRKEQVLVLLYENYVNDLQGTLNRITDFLGISSFKGLPGNTRYNVSGSIRSSFLQKAFKKISSYKRLKFGARRIIGERNFVRLTKNLYRMNTKYKRKETILPEIEDLLLDYYLPSIKNLEVMLDQDLSAWKR